MDNQERSFQKIRAHPAYSKITRYCAYQERSRREVRDKLSSWGAEEEIDDIIELLERENFIHEQRYVAHFIRGKFTLKRWGKKKIAAALRRKGVDSNFIQQGLYQINNKVYQETLHTLAQKKGKSLNSSDKDRQKLVHYLMQKGYEADLVCPVVQQVLM